MEMLVQLDRKESTKRDEGNIVLIGGESRKATHRLRGRNKRS